MRGFLCYKLVQELSITHVKNHIIEVADVIKTSDNPLLTSRIMIIIMTETMSETWPIWYLLY